MANMTITNFNLGGIVIGNAIYDEDALVEFAGADTYVVGTILARNPATGYYCLYDDTATDGTEIPRGVLTIETIATGAGNLPIRPLRSGIVRSEKLVIDNGNTVTDFVLDDLRAYADIIGSHVEETNVLDNQ